MNNKEKQIRNIAEHAARLCKDFDNLSDKICKFMREHKGFHRVDISGYNLKLVKAWANIVRVRDGFEGFLEGLK